jgi:hypothetical protein
MVFRQVKEIGCGHLCKIAMEVLPRDGSLGGSDR